MNRKQRNKNRATAATLRRYCPSPQWKCSHCGELTPNGHFVPPCFGEPGFYICKKESTT